MAALIHFFSQNIRFAHPHPRKTSEWIKNAIRAEGFILRGLNFIFCTDVYLLRINREYLHHSSLTDIITFDNSDIKMEIEADIFISINRVKENAKNLNINFYDELDRVIIHGVLHLMGYSDKTRGQIKQMRKKEDVYLSLR